jgi:hypothetical protein
MAWVPSLVPAVVAGHVKGCGGGLARFSSDSWRIVAAFDLCLDGDTDRHAELRVAHQRAHPRRASPPPCQRGDTAQTATTSANRYQEVPFIVVKNHRQFHVGVDGITAPLVFHAPRHGDIAPR